MTWGVFPAQEVVQTTIIEKESFLSWKVRPSIRSFISFHFLSSLSSLFFLSFPFRVCVPILFSHLSFFLFSGLVSLRSAILIPTTLPSQFLIPIPIL